jgi:hypothetical protein
VRKGNKLAKFWVRPNIVLAESFGMSPKELNEIFKIVDSHKRQIVKAWNEHFGS